VECPGWAGPPGRVLAGARSGALGIGRALGQAGSVFVASPSQGWKIHVTDLTTGHCGTVVLNSKYGPAFSAQKIGNALGWGIVDDTPNSFVWEPERPVRNGDDTATSQTHARR